MTTDPAPGKDQDLASTREALRAAQQGFAEFAYAAAHDLGRPASQIRALVSLLLDSIPANADRELLTHIEAAAARLEENVKALTAYAEAVTAPFLPVEVDCAALVRAVAIEFGGEPVVELGPLPLVRADCARLAQVFRQLLDNARKFRGDAPARVEITASEDAERVVFSVRDHGPGIEPAQKDRIFQPFKRLLGDRYPGTGMGLAICRRIVEMHGGRMWLETGGAAGADFRFTIPG